MYKRILIPVALIFTLLLAACGGSPTTGPAATPQQAAMGGETAGQEMETMAGDGAAEAMAAADEEEPMDGGGHDGDMESMDAMVMDAAAEDQAEAMSGDDMAGDEAGAAMPHADRPAWQTITLTNAATGAAFTLADFQGKTVFVEPMATWCGNCRQQQGEVLQAKSQLGDDVLFVGLSLETNLPPQDLASYAQSNGFDWTYAVMSQELLSALAEQFGRSITNAPATPHFIIHPDGSFTDLATGIHSASEIVSEIQEAQS